MKIMTIPDDFRWINYSLDELNLMSEKNKKSLLKKEEIKIRQSIGEAVPTSVFFQIACNIKTFMEKEHFNSTVINKKIERYKLDRAAKLLLLIKENPLNLGGGDVSTYC